MFKHFPDGSEFTVQQDHDNVILFDGNNDRLGFLLPAEETIITTGRNQTLNLAKTGDDVTILDMGQGLTLGLVATEFGATKIYGFGHDQTGHVFAASGVTIAPDGQDGTLLSGFSGGGTFDFIGDDHLTMAQITIPISS